MTLKDLTVSVCSCIFHIVCSPFKQLLTPTMKSVGVVLALLLQSYTVIAFVISPRGPLRVQSVKYKLQAALPSPEESAAALQDYMVKSGEVRAKYEAEIKVGDR